LLQRVIRTSPRSFECTGPRWQAHKSSDDKLPSLSGSHEKDRSPRKDFFYFDDDGRLVACAKKLEVFFCDQRTGQLQPLGRILFTCLRSTGCSPPDGSFEAGDITADQQHGCEEYRPQFQGHALASCSGDVKDYPQSGGLQSFNIDPTGVEDACGVNTTSGKGLNNQRGRRLQGVPPSILNSSSSTAPPERFPSLPGLNVRRSNSRTTPPTRGSFTRPRNVSPSRVFVFTTMCCSASSPAYATD